MAYDTNEYGEILNGPGTYAQLTEDLKSGPVMLDWNDQRGTLLNVLFAYPKRKQCRYGGGQLDLGSGLAVAVMGFGAWQFSSPTDWPYVSEKLGLMGGTTQGLADLINATLSAS